MAVALFSFMIAIPSGMAAGMDKHVGDPSGLEREAKKACLAGDPDRGASILLDLYLEKNNPTYLFNRGRCYQQSNRYQEAIASFREYLRKVPNTATDDRTLAQKHLSECQDLLAKEGESKPPAAGSVQPAMLRPGERSAGTAARSPRPGPTVAVLYFDYEGKNNELSILRKGLAQMLISDLAGTDSWRIVERDRLESILAEQKLAREGKLDKATVAKVGKLLGAQYLIVGGYFDLLGALRIDARVLSVETGGVVGSAGSAGKPDEFLAVEQSISGELAKILSVKLGTYAEPTERTPNAARPGTGVLAGKGGKGLPKTPARLRTRTAVSYSQALALLDTGDKAAAAGKLREVVNEQPDFALAAEELNRLAP